MSLLVFSSPTKAQEQPADAVRQPGGKILVAYFSCTGTTEKAASAIARAVDGDLYRIVPAVAYTPADLDWTDESSRSSKEMADENSRPALGGGSLDPAEYDAVFLGYPIWWDACPRAVNTFLEKYDFSGKTVIPFATSGGSGIEKAERSLKSHCPQANWKKGKLLNHMDAAAWTKSVLNSGC